MILSKIKSSNHTPFFIAKFILLSLFFSSCFTIHQPVKPFNVPSGSSPDYSNKENWAALPDKKDNADLIPSNSGLKENQNDAQTDVFFIYPTSYNGKNWNCEMKNKKINRQTQNSSIKHQATVFNESCKVYIPYYRQATLYSFFDKNDNGKKALDFAYQDVKNAFEYYLKYYNHGRPIIIAGHSQGTTHAIRLLKEFFDNQPLVNQLVTAYLVGMPVKINEFKNIVPCQSPEETSCFASWITYGESENPDYYGRYHLEVKDFEENLSKTICTNPLDWKTDTMLAQINHHLGSVPFSFRKIHQHNIDAQCRNGILWISKPKNNGYPALSGGNYHLWDYNLFYLNIRQNVKERVEIFLKNHILDKR